MVRWFSEAKSVKLPEQKVQVNYIYVNPKGLNEVQNLLSESLKSFGKWDKMPISVWLCSNQDEWLGAHINNFGESYIDLAEYLSKIVTAFELAYSPREVQSLIGINVPKLLRPNILVRTDELPKMKLKEKKGVFKHEMLHKPHADYGFTIPIIKVTQSYYDLDSDFKKLLDDLESACIDISTNEIGIDLGFENELLAALKYGAKFGLNYSKAHKKEASRSDLFRTLLTLSAVPIPFDYGEKKIHAEEMRKFLYKRYGQLEIEEPIELGKNLEKNLSGIKNPPKVPEIEKVYNGVIKKFEDFRRH